STSCRGLIETSVQVCALGRSYKVWVVEDKGTVLPWLKEGREVADEQSFVDSVVDPMKAAAEIGGCECFSGEHEDEEVGLDLCTKGQYPGSDVMGEGSISLLQVEKSKGQIVGRQEDFLCATFKEASTPKGGCGMKEGVVTVTRVNCQEEVGTDLQSGVGLFEKVVTRGDTSLPSLIAAPAGREGDLTGASKGSVTKFGKEGLERNFFDPLVAGMERVMDQITEQDPKSFNPDLEFNGLVSKVGPGGVFVVNESLGPNKPNKSHVVVSSNSDTLEISIEGQVNSSFPYSHKSKPKNKSLQSQVGTHKCLQLVEAMNEGKICVKKKKGKKGSVMGELTRPVEDLGVQLQSNVAVIGGSGVRENSVERRKEDDSEVVPQLRVSSSSGLQFLMGEEEFQVPVSP
ncbi:hypothetical protein A2U01_0015887, partial [Trifolium medium]|nr:hypothetical protein [Trifolium medium]